MKIRKDVAASTALAEAAMQLALIRDIAPSIHRSIIPTVTLPEAIVEDVYGWYGEVATNNTIKNQAALVVHHIARLGFMLSKDQTVELYETALDIAGNKKTHLYSTYLDFLFRFDSNESMQAACDRFLARSDAWQNGQPLAWMRVVGFLLRIGDEKAALRIMQTYSKNMKLRSVEEHLQVAEFSARKGLKNKRISQAASIYRMLVENRKINLLRDFFHNKRVAVVGNGPQENGGGSGKKIDDHTVVVRMNDFTTRKNSAADYGKKFTVWALNEKFRKPLDLKTLPSGPAWITQCMDHNSTTYEHVCNLINLMKRKVPIVDFSPEDVMRLGRELYIPCNYLRPTTGVKIISYLKLMTKASFGPGDIYGLSCKESSDASYDWGGGYVYSDGAKSHRDSHVHSLRKEHDMFVRLFPKMRKKKNMKEHSCPKQV